MTDYEKVMADLRQLKPDQKQEAMLVASSELPDAGRREVTEALGITLSPSEKKGIVEKLGGTIEGPDGKTKNILWVIVVGAFALVLVGSAATLALAVWHKPESDAVKPELIFSLFTSVVGFLAGLFVRPPGQNGG